MAERALAKLHKIDSDKKLGAYKETAGSGGARPAEAEAKEVSGECVANTGTAPKCSNPTFKESGAGAISGATWATCWPELARWPSCRNDGFDSSMACLTAWRSSLTETTGNSKTRAQPSVPMMTNEERAK